jgi:hypothetical protein
MMHRKILWRSHESYFPIFYDLRVLLEGVIVTIREIGTVVAAATFFAG